MSKRDSQGENSYFKVVLIPFTFFLMYGIFLLIIDLNNVSEGSESDSNTQAYKELQERLEDVNERSTPLEAQSHEVYRALRDSKELRSESKRIVEEAEEIADYGCLFDDGFDYSLRSVDKVDGVWYYNYDVYYQTSFVGCGGLFRFNFRDEMTYHIGTYRFNWKAVKGQEMSRGELRLGDVTKVADGEGFVDRR